MLGQLYLQMQIEADRVGTRIGSYGQKPENFPLKLRTGKAPEGTFERIYAMTILMALAFLDLDLENFANLGKDRDAYRP